VASLARVDDIEAARLASGLDDAFALVAGCFFRREVRARARACVAGMLSGLERKTGWSLAEHAGEKSPDGMQRLFTTARWDQDAVRDGVRGYVVSALGDPDGVLIGDDTGSRRKGPARPGCSGSTRAPQARSRTASSASSWPTRRRRATR
jgi:SRSO17 transposase